MNMTVDYIRKTMKPVPGIIFRQCSKTPTLVIWNEFILQYRHGHWISIRIVKIKHDAVVTLFNDKRFV